MKRKVFSLIVLALCVIITLSTVVNVFGDNEAVEKLATDTVCPATEKCNAVKIALMRTPVGQTFTFSVKGKSVDVVCRRAAIIFGDYRCEMSK